MDGTAEVGGDLARLVDEVHARIVDHDPDVAREATRVEAIVRSLHPLRSSVDVAAIVAGVTARATGLGPLEPLLGDPAVTDVMVNGPGPVWIERAGQIEQTAVELDRRSIELVVERVVAPLGRRVDRTSPLVDARLPDGSRVHVVVPPLAVDGPTVTIRRFGTRAVPLTGFCHPDVAELLCWAVGARWNLLISGGTGAGKTTLLNALGAHLPSAARVLTVEDAAELRLPGAHVVRLEARPPSADGLGEVTIRDLVRNSLRMRPDRLIVGEVRGAEALDMLQAMNTGHEGSMSTCHANSPADALRRLETMVRWGDGGLPLDAVRDQITATIDAVVQVARRPGGGRRIVAVDELGDDAPAGAPVGTRRLADGDRVLAPPGRAPRADPTSSRSSRQARDGWPCPPSRADVGGGGP